MRTHIPQAGICTAILVAALACAKEPVEWSAVRYSLVTPGQPFESDSSEAAALPGATPQLRDPTLCKASLRLARSGKKFFAAWWSVRKDSSAQLMFSRSDDGGEWATPIVVDSRDNGGKGCSRDAPAIATDPVSAYVHLAYSTESASGAAVYVIHSMDGGESFHSPVAIVFGSRTSPVSIASEGDRVAAAYVDPNSARGQIFVALSTTTGHIFDMKLPVSEENAAASAPVVRLRGRAIDVSWTEVPSADSGSVRHASRLGQWR